MSESGVGFVGPLFALIGLASLGFFLQLAGHIYIEQGRRIHGYGALASGVIFGFSPLWAWIFYHW